MEKRPKSLQPFIRFCMTIGEIPTSYMNSMTYEEQIIWLCNFLEKEVIPVVNNNSEVVKELQEWFENLDVQEEINNKLEEMVDSGELEEIIAQYLQLSSVLSFNTLEEMRNATNIIEGNICYTAGHLTYNDGKGAFYKIRTITSSDIVDGFNIVALNISNTLIGERLINYYINEINESIDEINESIDEINDSINETNEKIEELKINKKIDPKFVSNPRSYFEELDIKGNKTGLSFEVFYRISNPSLSMQGVAINKITGDMLYCNGSEIYKLSNSSVPVKTTIYTGNYGHGGDSCILNNKMYISDSDNNQIHVVDLSNGNKTTYTLDNSQILNTIHTDYVPKIGGICMDNDENYCYIGIIDDENSNHTIKEGSTIRVYKYDFNNNYEKLFEKEQDICYLQGLTKDDNYFYYTGNKPFITTSQGTTYDGNKLYIIDNYTYETYDILENNINYEYEGLDYGSINGCEGLVTVVAHYGLQYYHGLFSFNGNVTEDIIFKDTETEKAYSVKSRGGTVTTYITLYGTFNQDSTYTYDDFFIDNYPMKAGSGGETIGIFATSYIGSNRNHLGHAEWDFVRNRLIIRTLTSTTQSDSLKLTFIYNTD